MSRAIGLTRRQATRLFDIERYISAHGQPPLLRELAEQWGVSSASASRTLDALADKGYIARHPARHRGILLLRVKHCATCTCPTHRSEPKPPAPVPARVPEPIAADPCPSRSGGPANWQCILPAGHAGDHINHWRDAYWLDPELERQQAEAGR